MKEELAVKNLREVKKILDELGIKYWLEAGTLLGAVRDGKIIKWDHDIDLGMIDDGSNKIVSAFPKLEERGFRVQFVNLKIYKNFFSKYVTIDRFGCPIGLTLYQVKGKYATTESVKATNPISWGLVVLRELLLFPQTEADVWPKLKFIAKVIKSCLSLLPPKSKKPLSDMVWSVLKKSTDELHQIIFPKHYFEKLGAIKFYGMTFNIPSNVEDYLEYYYGKDWKTPKREWRWPHDSGAVRVLKA